MSNYFPFLVADDTSKSHSLVHELLRHGKFHAASAVMKELYKKNDKLWVVNLLTNLCNGAIPLSWNCTEDIPSIFYNNKKLLEHEQNRVAQIESICQNKFLKSHVVSTQISSRDEITEKIVNLLGRHKNANRS